MHTLTNLIEDIRAALAYSESVPPDRLEAYAREYARECNKLNDRLKQCLPHLRGGNIAEAVRLAEQQPNIIETFSLLDFENRQDWLEVCDGLGYDVPMPLAVDAFQELNDAYVQMAPLEPLLKRHRLLALNGSPIRERLGVLRSIAKADSMNIHWQADQEVFEKARIKELEREVDDALAKNDMPRIHELFRELVQPWIIAPPMEYRMKICTAVLKVQADKLVHRFMAFDYPGAYAVEQTIYRILSEAQITMPATIGSYIQPAIQWLRDTEAGQQYLAQFHWELQQFQEALMGNSNRPTLKNHYTTLRDTARLANQKIPKELEEQYHSQVDYMNRVETFFWILGGSVIAFMFLMLAFVIFR